MVSSSVRNMYIAYRTIAVVRILGTSLPTTGPGISARSMCIARPESESVGASAMRRVRTPMPPIQCVRERQNCIPCESISTSAIAVAPVVENLLAVSKIASI